MSIPAIPNASPTFSDTFHHGVDPKGRITIPSAWRDTDADEFYVMIDRTKSFLRLMPPAEFFAVADKIAHSEEIAGKSTPQERTVFLRHFYSRAAKTSADKQGRMLLPEAQRKLLGLENEVVLVGSCKSIEVWNPVRWAATQQTEESTFDRMAELAGL